MVGCLIGKPGRSQIMLAFFWLLGSGLVLAAANGADVPEYDAGVVARLAADAREKGDPARGAQVFVDAKVACLSCHKVGQQGGVIGPELSAVGRCSHIRFE